MVKIIREGQFQSTLPVWGATEAQYQKTTEFVISIHAPRVGSDHDDEPKPPALIISIHAPRVGSDGGGVRPPKCHFSQFQSTLPVWGATGCGFRQITSKSISIHAPRVGSDGAGAGFEPTSAISIHAPRVGSDGGYAHPHSGASDFNPRSPCGERPRSGLYPDHAEAFQSTLPVWGATLARAPSPAKRDFNPRSPCGERHPPHRDSMRSGYDFNPRSPCGERRRQSGRRRWTEGISIHAPRVGSDFVWIRF